jgi:putative methyltransferase (TIGR04325 family)
VIENEAVCLVGRRLYGPDDTITFMSALPGDIPALDIVHCRSALQYVDDYQALLRRLLRYRPRFALFLELAAGNIPTYATAQLNLRGSVIACWFHSLDEIVGIARDEGYAPLVRMPSGRFLPAAAVPPSHRLERPSTVLFGRVAST